MTMLNFSYAVVKDAKKFQEYIKAASEVMAGEDIEIVVRGDYSKTVRGDESSAHIAAVFRYPDMSTFDRIYSSEEYQAIIPLRDQACDMTIKLYEE